MLITSHPANPLIYIVFFAVLFASSPTMADDEQPDNDQSDADQAERWLTAVDNSQRKKSVRIASEIVPRISQEPDPAYTKLASSRGIHPRFLSDAMNDVDYYRWRTALFFKELSSAIVKNENTTIEPLFRAVVERLETNDPEDDIPLWPYRIWKLEKGLCDRQAWVLCELAYQQGWETQIVYLRDPETDVSHHTIAELRKDDVVYTADPFKDVLVKGHSVRQLADNEDLLRRYWPESKKLWPEFANAIFWTPSYPQDYCPRNQKLHRILQRRLGDDSPRFGEDPRERLEHYKQLDRQNGSHDDEPPMRLWFYPFVLLRATLARGNNQSQ